MEPDSSIIVRKRSAKIVHMMNLALEDEVFQWIKQEGIEVTGTVNNLLRELMGTGETQQMKKGRPKELDEHYSSEEFWETFSTKELEVYRSQISMVLARRPMRRNHTKP